MRASRSLRALTCAALASGAAAALAAPGCAARDRAARGGPETAPASEAGPDGGPSSPGALRLEPDPEARTTPLSVEPPGLPFTVLVDLPGFAMFRPRPAEDGESWLVLGYATEAGLVASVRVSPAGAGPGDARACRDAALARLRATGPDLVEVVLGEAGGAARAAYVAGGLHGEGPRQRHGHAFFGRDGACVDVHVSFGDAGSAEAEGAERILGSVRFGERL